MSKRKTFNAELKTEQVKESAKKEVASKVMYIGPTIKGIVKHASVFEGKLPTRIEAKINENPLLAKMLVKVEDAPEALKKIQDEKSALAVIYRKLEMN